MEFMSALTGVNGVALGFGMARLLARSQSAALTQSFESLQSRQTLLEARATREAPQNGQKSRPQILPARPAPGQGL